MTSLTAPSPTLPRDAGEGVMARLPSVRGRLTANAPLAQMTWFRVGGPAEVLFKPADIEDLQHFLQHCPADVPVTVIGVASNLLVRDGGVDGVVIRLGGEFSRAEARDGLIYAGTAALSSTVSKVAQEAGIAGLEFLTGVPGTLGGGFRTNAGCYGGELGDCIVSARAVNRSGQLLELTPADLKLSYRHCGAPEDWIFVDAVLQGRPDDPAAIAERMEEIRRKREESPQFNADGSPILEEDDTGQMRQAAGQPLRTRTSGSTFANPEGHSAWKLVDEAGCRGLKLGGAQISEKHTNFMINTGTATAADLEDLGEEVRRRVLEKSGITLRWEIRRIGRRKEG